MIDNGADPNARFEPSDPDEIDNFDSDIIIGGTPLHFVFAQEKPQIHTAKLLVQHGARLDLTVDTRDTKNNAAINQITIPLTPLQVWEAYIDFKQNNLKTVQREVKDPTNFWGKLAPMFDLTKHQEEINNQRTLLKTVEKELKELEVISSTKLNKIR